VRGLCRRRHIRQPNLLGARERRPLFLRANARKEVARRTAVPPRERAVEEDDDGENAYDARECKLPLFARVSRRERREIEEQTDSERRVRPGSARLPVRGLILSRVRDAPIW
jgi:hypothetical protein